MQSAAVQAPSKNTSLNSASPVIWRIGRISTPGWSSGTSRKLSPSRPTLPGVLRAMTKIHSDSWAREVHTFWPCRCHLPSSSQQRVRMAARSEPAPGSE